MQTVTALCGGVGGAKLALGLHHTLRPGDLNLIVNTGDDFRHYGLLVCPDLDTVLYTLSGRVDPNQGWGRAEESLCVQAELAAFGENAWFKLGDRDIALHLLRRQMMDGGATLTDIMANLSGRLGIETRLIPMSDAPAPTIVETTIGKLAFQEYFVRHRAQPEVRSLYYSGTEVEAASAALEALNDLDNAAIVVCPSNPLLSIEPILAVAAIRQTLLDRHVPCIAVAPLVAGQALKGPTAKIMEEIGEEPSALSVAKRYQGLIDVLVIDDSDAGLAPEIERLGIKAPCASIVMSSLEDKRALAQRVLELAAELKR
jgi:LPPG:FO 2-phospho-L-lactate transferase